MHQVPAGGRIHWASAASAWEDPLHQGWYQDGLLGSPGYCMKEELSALFEKGAAASPRENRSSCSPVKCSETRTVRQNEQLFTEQNALLYCILKALEQRVTKPTAALQERVEKGQIPDKCFNSNVKITSKIKSPQILKTKNYKNECVLKERRVI